MQNNIQTLSIIIPCYNVGRYIGDAIRSIVKNSEQNIEVIIINDGSTDNTDEVIKSEILGISHFTYLKQKNKGVSAARNLGLTKASGTYITFLDGDDLLDKNYLNMIFEVINKYHPDIIEYDAYRFSEEKSLLIKTDNIKISTFNGFANINNPKDLLSVFSLSRWYLWGRVFKRELIKDDFFVDGKRYEETMFTPYVYVKANSIYGINKPLYGYRNNPESITNRPQKTDVDDYLYSINKMIDYIQNDGKKYGELFAISALKSFSSLKYLHNSVYGFFYYRYDVSLLSKRLVYTAKHYPYCMDKQFRNLLMAKYFKFFSFGSFLKKTAKLIVR